MLVNFGESKKKKAIWEIRLINLMHSAVVDKQHGLYNTLHLLVPRPKISMNLQLENTAFEPRILLLLVRKMRSFQREALGII